MPFPTLGALSFRSFIPANPYLMGICTMFHPPFAPDVSPEKGKATELPFLKHYQDIAKHTKIDMIWVAGRNPTLVSHSLRGVAMNLKATTLTYLAIALPVCPALLLYSHFKQVCDIRLYLQTLS